MKILSITAGAAGMYCGSCSRDNALAVELLARGHDVTLLPLYTPTTTDETNVSRDRVLFGGISVYLQQYLALFRKTPRFLDRLWDSPRVIGAFASRSISTDPKLLGDMTISMLEGDRGLLRKEFAKLLEWLAHEPVPDVINLPNSLLIGLARPLREALKRPVCCTLQGEDLFLDGLIEPYRSRALDLIRRQVAGVDAFIAVSHFYVPVMAQLLGIPANRIAVAPLGINMTGYERGRRGHDNLYRVGYFARIAPEKGLHVLRPPAWPTSSRITAPWIARASSRFFAASTSCRCRRPTTSRRACSCSRRWRAACRSCNRGAARSRRSWRRQAAACSSHRTIPRRWPTGCTTSGRTARRRKRSASAAFTGSARTTASRSQRTGSSTCTNR